MNVPESIPTRIRVLFVVEAVTLAHVARSVALAKRLDPLQFETLIACDDRFDRIIGDRDGERVPMRSIAPERFEAALKSGRAIYDLATLIDYVAADRSAIQAVRPDVVVGDFRLSLTASARLEGVPYINLTNGGWSPYARMRFLVPDLPLVRMCGTRVAQALFDVVRPAAFALHARPIQQLRKHFGLPALSWDLRRVYTDGDMTVYADLGELFPTEGMPATHRFIGPVVWSPAMDMPAWWSSVDLSRPLVYVNLGSSGLSRMLPRIVEILAAMPVTVVAATAGRIKLGPFKANVHHADYLPGSAVAELASVVICNGGSPTAYQALEKGVPVIGIPGNLDQFLNMEAIERAGPGRLLRPEAVERQLGASVGRVLQPGPIRETATRFRLLIERSVAAAGLETAIRAAVASRQASAA